MIYFSYPFFVAIVQVTVIVRRVWRYQRGNQNPYVVEVSTKHTHKTKDQVTRTPLKTGGELRWSGRVHSSSSTSGTRRVNL